jgi:adenosylhomocysteine nucleosidase
MTTNIGAYADNGGTVNVQGDVFGVFHGERPRRNAGRAAEKHAVDVGIIAVLDHEMRAVVGQLQRYREYRTRSLPDGARAHEARLTAHDGAELRVAALQALEQGQRSAILAYQRLQQAFQPRIVLLVGIAGGINDRVSIGDVVIGDEVVYYDARRETSAGPRRRGQSHGTSTYIKYRLHDFSVRYGDSIEGPDGSSIRIFRGPIGSGEAVVTDGDSEVLDWLRRYNEKVLAVETEIGGVGQAWYENVDGDRSLDGWLTIRGISDKANAHDWSERRYLVSCRAVVVMDRLLPLLSPVVVS